MEDEVLPVNGATTSGEETSSEVMVNVNLAFNGIVTKSEAVDAGTTNPVSDKESQVYSAVVALVNADGQIMMIRDASGNIEPEGNIKDVKFLTKVKSGVKAIAIVNSKNASSYLICKTLSDLNSVIEMEANQEFLVKVGEKNDIFEGYEDGSTSTTNLTPLNVVIPVIQLTARIDLMGLRYRKAEGSAVNSVKIISAQLVNVNNNSNVYNTVAKTMSGQEVKGDVVDGSSTGLNQILTLEDWYGNNPNDEIGKPLHTDYSYINTSAVNPVKMRITYSVNDGDQKDVDVTINNGKVEAGCLYRLYVGMVVKNDEISTEVVCYTNDWISEDITIDVKD